MRIEDVKIQFEKTQEIPFDWSPGGFAITVYAFGILVLCIGIIYFVTRRYKDWDDAMKMLPGLCILLAAFLCQATHVANVHEEATEKAVAKWKENYALPYINSLPVEKHEVVFVKIEANTSQEIKDSGTYLRSEEVHRTPLTVSYKHETGVITKTDWYSTNMGLTPEAKPYVEYVTLPEPLGVTKEGEKAEFWAGQYNYKVYLPENYEFKDIK